MKQSVIHPPQRKMSILRNEKTGLSHLLISAPVSMIWTIRMAEDLSK
jgi:hypothetical protein